MRTNLSTYVLWALAALLLSAGCRRELLSAEQPPVPVPTPELVPVTIALDWSESGLTVAQMKHASVRIYPESGGAPTEVVLSQDLTATTVWLPVGAYRAVGVNETMSSKDWQGTDFGNIHDYHTLMASIRPLVSKANETEVGSGDHLAVASSDLFEVTPEMRGQTEEQKPLVISLKPQQLTQPILVRVRIGNLDNARSISAQLSGMYASRLLSSGQYVDQRVTHSFPLLNRTYDTTNPHDGTVEAQFYVFKLVDDTTPHNLALKIELLDGSTVVRNFEVTGKIVLGQTIYEVQVGFTADDPIILPPIPPDYLSVTFNLDWSRANLPFNQVRRVSVWVYPHDGAAAIELISEQSLTTVSTHLKAGSYSVLAINERTQTADWQGLDFLQTSAYRTSAAVLRTADHMPALEVDPLVGAAADLLEVQENTPRLLTLVLEPVTKVLEVRAQVTNLDNAKLLSCRLTGMSTGSVLCSKSDVAQTAVYHFDMTDRVYDPLDKRNGQISTKFYVFGTPNVSAPRTLQLDFTLLDLTPQSTVVDVSTMISPTTTGYELQVGPIVLPERPRLPVDGDPAVDPWNPEQNNPLQ